MMTERRNNKYKTGVMLMVMVTFVFSQAWGKSGGDFMINKSTIASGGGQSNGGDFRLSGSIGQLDASNALNGGDFSLAGGFWAGGNNNDIIFKHGFEQ